MTRESWIQSNRRAMSFMLIMESLSIVLLIVIGFIISAPELKIGLFIVAGITVIFTLVTLYHVLSPRIGYQNGHLLIYMHATGPYRVPIHTVECFLMGQADTNLPGELGSETKKTITIKIRLREKAEQWKRKDVMKMYGTWSDSHVTIRGVWCEKIDKKSVYDLNKQLAAAQSETVKETAGS